MSGLTLCGQNATSLVVQEHCSLNYSRVCGHTSPTGLMHTIKYLCLHNYDGSHIFGLMPLQLVCVLAILIVHARLLPTLAVTTTVRLATMFKYLLDS